MDNKQDITKLLPNGPNLWTFNDPIRVAGLKIGHRMSVLRLSGGPLVVHSPVAWSQSLGGELAKLGPIQSVVAPSRMHDLYLRDWHQQYPNAGFYAAEGLAQELAEIGFKPFPRDPMACWGEELEHLPVLGMPQINEEVFFHKSTASLIVADLVFNLLGGTDLFTRIAMSLNGAYGKLAASRLFRSMIRDHDAFRASLDRVFQWDFERVIVGHGTIVEQDGKARMREVFSWSHRR
jgi:hypothetical protein